MTSVSLETRRFDFCKWQTGNYLFPTVSAATDFFRLEVESQLIRYPTEQLDVLAVFVRPPGLVPADTDVGPKGRL